MTRRVREKLQNEAWRGKKRCNLREKLRNERKSIINYERNSLKQKGTQEMLANSTKVYDLQGKVTYSATPLALEAHFEHFWTQGYERNCLVARRVREKLRNQALKGKKAS